MKKNGELSLEQLRQKLHISKRKAAWMLQNGVIPCRIVDTPTRLRYYVKEEDLRAYMKQSVTESKKEFIRGPYPDTLSIYRVAKIIGYSERTIRWHIAKGRLFVTLKENKYLVSKYSLIKFLASDKGFAMQPKSEWHEKAIRWFIEVMNK